MSYLLAVFVLAVLTAVSHSVLSERIFLRPLRAEPNSDTVFSGAAPRRLATAMFHLPSLCWVTMAASMLVLHPGTAGYRTALHLFAGVFAISALGNFWAVGRPHPGWVPARGGQRPRDRLSLSLATNAPKARPVRPSPGGLSAFLRLHVHAAPQERPPSGR